MYDIHTLFNCLVFAVFFFVVVCERRAESNKKQCVSVQVENAQLRNRCRRMVVIERQLGEHRNKGEQVRTFRNAANEAAANARVAEARNKTLEREALKWRER